METEKDRGNEVDDNITGKRRGNEEDNDEEVVKQIVKRRFGGRG